MTEANKKGSRLWRLGIFALVAISCLALGACMLLKQSKFGKLPQGERLAAVQGSDYFMQGQFQNLIDTPKFSRDVGLFDILWQDFRHPVQGKVPSTPLPHVKPDLTTLDPGQDMVIWLGHSSYFIQLEGKRILLDPVFSNYGAPFSFLNKAFPGTDIYQPEDMPAIDYLVISHDHWDHLDYPTVNALQSKVRHVVVPLGVGSYFENWGYSAEQILEGDWSDQVSQDPGLKIYILPARHYSGRLFKQNQTLWAGFAFVSSSRRLFFSGDSGYGPHFREIGKSFGPFDLVALDCGQYDERWAYIHMNPEEAVMAAADLEARSLLPAHVGRFTIARHPWDEPFNRAAAANRNSADVQLLTPQLGEMVYLRDGMPNFSHWWQSVVTLDRKR